MTRSRFSVICLFLLLIFVDGAFLPQGYRHVSEKNSGDDADKGKVNILHINAGYTARYRASQQYHHTGKFHTYVPALSIMKSSPVPQRKYAATRGERALRRRSLYWQVNHHGHGFRSTLRGRNRSPTPAPAPAVFYSIPRSVLELQALVEKRRRRWSTPVFVQMV